MSKMTLGEALQLGLRKHQANQLAEAEAIYRQVLQHVPDNPDALHFLGVLRDQTGQSQSALELIGKAVTKDPNNADAHNNLGLVQQKLGQPDKAVASFRTAVKLRPTHARAHHNLAVALRQRRELDGAIAAARQAIQHEPTFGEAFNTLGAVLLDNDKPAEALDAFKQALAVQPNYGEALSNCGAALQRLGRFDEAVEHCRRAIAAMPDHAEAHNNLGVALSSLGQRDEAIKSYRKAISLRPDYLDAQSNLANDLALTGRETEAITRWRQIVREHPSFARAYVDLAGTLSRQGKHDEAHDLLVEATKLQPDDAPVRNQLGWVLSEQGKLGAAIEQYERAVALDPNFAEAYNNLGNALANQARHEPAVRAFERAVALKPAFAHAHSNLLLALHYDSSNDPARIFQEHQRWARQHGQAIAGGAHLNDRSPDRPLRIGYLSPDFRNHPVGRFIEPALEQRDRSKFHVVCYSNVQWEDEGTERFKNLADEWRAIKDQTDDAVAEQIRADRIDILVDLAGHTSHNRLPVLARRPAPVQVTYLGYPDTTGLASVDYRLSDIHADPPGLTEAYHSEQLHRLPGSFLCYHPPAGAPPVSALPALDNRFITFGSFNNFAKTSAATLAMWMRLLQAVPDAHLMLKAKSLADDATRQFVETFFANQGIDPTRLRLLGPEPTVRAHLQAYDHVDVALDPFPYHGTTTTLEALWQGVPVVTLAGQTHVSRVGASILTNLGLPQWIASSPDQYVEIATALASDVDDLRHHRAGLRAMLQRSPLTDAKQFTRNLESAYRQIWQSWCAKPQETKTYSFDSV